MDGHIFVKREYLTFDYKIKSNSSCQYDNITIQRSRIPSDASVLKKQSICFVQFICMLIQVEDHVDKVFKYSPRKSQFRQYFFLGNNKPY